MAASSHVHDRDYVIQNIGDLKNNYREYDARDTGDPDTNEDKESAELTGYVPISKIVPGPSSLRGRSSAYTPSMGGNPLDMGK